MHTVWNIFKTEESLMTSLRAPRLHFMLRHSHAVPDRKSILLLVENSLQKKKKKTGESYKSVISWIKVGDRSQGRPEGSLFNSYEIEVYGRALLLSQDCSTLHLILLSVLQGGIKYHFWSLWYDSTCDWNQVSRTIGEHSTHLANTLESIYMCMLYSSIFKYIIDKEEILW